MRLLLLLGFVGMVACTSSKGVTITSLKTEIDFSCRAISAINDSVVWASGSKGTVLRSINGGRSWKQCSASLDKKLDFRNLYAWNKDSAIVLAVSEPAQAFKTVDGGETWKMVFYKDIKGMFINSVAFKDQNNGVAVGDPIDGELYVLHTNNGGDSWVEVNTAKASKKEGFFAASNTCVRYLSSGEIIFATGVSESAVYIASDTNFEWNKHETGTVKGGDSDCDGIYTVYMSNSGYGVVAGGNYLDVEQNKDIVAYTSNFGKNWNISKSNPHGFISCVEAFTEDDNILLAVGSDGCSISYNKGKKWSNISNLLPFGVVGYHTAAASGRGKCIFVAGERGQMAIVVLSRR